jgi:hypothetical protein
VDRAGSGVGDNLSSKTELKEVGSAEMPHKDGAFDEICAGNCIYHWPNPVDHFKDDLTGIRPERCNSRVAFAMILE